MVDTQSELGSTLIERSKSDAQARGFEQVGQRGRCKWRPVLSCNQMECGVVSCVPIHTTVGQAEGWHVGTDGADVAVIGTAEVAFKIQFNFAGKDHAGRYVQPLEVRAHTSSPSLDVELCQVIRTVGNRVEPW